MVMAPRQQWLQVCCFKRDLFPQFTPQSLFRCFVSVEMASEQSPAPWRDDPLDIVAKLKKPEVVAVKHGNGDFRARLHSWHCTSFHYLIADTQRQCAFTRIGNPAQPAQSRCIEIGGADDSRHST